jgi:RES domain-containing protein
MFLWRISNHSTLEGRGGLLRPLAGIPKADLSSTLLKVPAGALVEHPVHLELNPARLPKSYRLLKADGPDDLPLATVSVADLPPNWITHPIATRTMGDEWLALKSSALLRVPSAILPETSNVLLNPEYLNASRVKVLWHAEHPWDTRLFAL